MKILHLPAYFYPEKAASSYLIDNIYQAISNEGFETLVYTPLPTRGICDTVRNEYKYRPKESMYNNHMIVYRFKLMKEGRSAFGRAIRYTVSCWKQILRGVFYKESKSCDIMLVFSTPPIQGAMAAIIKYFNRIPIVYNLQDIFPDSLVGSSLVKNGSFLWKIGRKIEDFTYRHADKIIVISEDFKKNIMEKGVPENKIEVVYNWVDEKAVIDIPRSNNILFKKYNLDPSKFYLTYCGNIGLTQNMELLVSVAGELQSEYPSIQFVLIGEGAYLNTLKNRILEFDLRNIVILPFQPYEDISHVFSLGDVGLVISKPGVGANSVPSKTWSIMSASRPVLANFDENELMTIIEENECGIFTKAGDELAFKNAILKLYFDEEKCRELGRKGRSFVMDRLTREVGTKKYVDVIRDTYYQSLQN
ncbi:MAG: glycosyltransferase family 4 protein [Bacteroidales bacterium]|nr:glycosyltransferase family 4 protein [Bacteroidales bacterium]